MAYETTLEGEVIAFTAAAFDLNPQDVNPSMQLRRDFHLEGDGAQEFFGILGDTFGVDLERLRIYWTWHFPQQEGPGDWVQPAVGVCTLIGCVLWEVMGKGGPMWLWVIGVIVLWAALYRFCWPYRDPKPIPITVQDLIDAVRAHQWIKQYPENGPE
jgi:Flp pilus assembly protein TadB